MDAAILHLKNKKYRITPARKALLETLQSAKNPMTIPELVTCTNSNEVSVYRNIELFTVEHLVEVVQVADSLPRYALAHDHHHHIVCVSCDYIAHIPCVDTTQTITHDNFKTITDHSVTYYGTCSKCCNTKYSQKPHSQSI